MLTDVRYALRQLEGALESPCGRLDRIQRAIDALERVQERAEEMDGGEPCESCGRSMGEAQEFAPCEFAD